MAEESNNSGKVAVIILIIVFVLAGSGGAWYWFVYKPKEEARLEQIAKEKAEKERLEQEAQNKARYEQLIIEADSAFNQDDWQTAQPLYAEASALFPDQQYPKDQLAIVNAKLDEIAAREERKASGFIETVSSPTGRYYVLISSSLDDDLAMDYANKLANEGYSVKIVEHTMNNLSYFGVSLGDYGSWDQALSAVGEFNSYGEGVWVLKN